MKAENTKNICFDNAKPSNELLSCVVHVYIDASIIEKKGQQRHKKSLVSNIKIRMKIGWAFFLLHLFRMESWWKRAHEIDSIHTKNCIFSTFFTLFLSIYLSHLSFRVQSVHIFSYFYSVLLVRSTVVMRIGNCVGTVRFRCRSLGTKES